MTLTAYVICQVQPILAELIKDAKNDWSEVWIVSSATVTEHALATWHRYAIVLVHCKTTAHAHARVPILVLSFQHVEGQWES